MQLPTSWTNQRKSKTRLHNPADDTTNMSTQSTPPAMSTIQPTTEELDCFIRQLEDRDRVLSDQLRRHRAAATATTTRPNQAVSFDVLQDPRWTQPQGRLDQDFTTRVNQVDATQRRRPSQSPSSEDEPQQALAQGTLELLLQQMQRDRS